MDPQGYQRQIQRLERVRRERDNRAVERALAALSRAAETGHHSRGGENLMPYILDAVKSYATLGEIMGALRQVFGVYLEPVIV